MGRRRTGRDDKARASTGGNTPASTPCDTADAPGRDVQYRCCLVFVSTSNRSRTPGPPPWRNCGSCSDVSVQWTFPLERGFALMRSIQARGDVMLRKEGILPTIVGRDDVQRLVAEGAQLVEVLPKAEFD